MPLRLDGQAPDFAASFAALLAMKRETADDVDQAVQKIIADVIARGDAALIDYSLKFDKVDLARLGFAVSADEIAAAKASVAPEALAALHLAHQRISLFHEKQRPQDLLFTDPLGVELGWRWSPIDAAGLYVPGGTASYPSSVLMNAAPAKVAGVARLVMVVPAPGGHIDPLVLVAAQPAGVSEIYRVGGATANPDLASPIATPAPSPPPERPGRRPFAGHLVAMVERFVHEVAITSTHPCAFRCSVPSRGTR